VAREGSFVNEPPGKIHQRVLDEAAGALIERVIPFNIHRTMIYVDEKGRTAGCEDVFTKIQLCRCHCTELGLGAAFVDPFVR
jgi:2,4'-dihydroxyacetophenone dioxygenase